MPADRLTVLSVALLAWPASGSPVQRLVDPGPPAAAVIEHRAGSGPVFPDDGGFAGDGGPAAAARLHHPAEVAAHPHGGYVVADSDNHRIRRVDRRGLISTVAGSGRRCPLPTDPCGDGGPATEAALNTPHGVAVLPGGAVLIADTFDNRVRRVGTDGRITTVAGTGARCEPGEPDCGHGVPATRARLSWPVSAVPLADGSVLVADQHAPRVRLLRDGVLTDVAGTGRRGHSGDGGPAREARFRGIAAARPLPDGGLVISDGDNCRLRRVTPQGTVVPLAGSGPSRDCASLQPLPAAVVGDGGPATRARINVPGYLAVARDGSVLVTDVYGNRVRRIGPEGTITTVAGTGGPPAHAGDGGPALAARLAWPSGLGAVEGGLLLTDSGNNRVRFVHLPGLRPAPAAPLAPALSPRSRPSPPAASSRSPRPRGR